MLAVIFLGLIALWFLNYIHIEGINIPIPNIIPFIIDGTSISLLEILILVAVIWALFLMPNPIRIIVAILLILWVLSILNILVLGTFPLADVLVIAIIIGIILVLLSPRDSV